jgi:cell division septation protein DedD
MHPYKKRYTALLALLALWIGCAGTPQTSTPAANSQTRPTKALKEEFDPRSIQEDLLLIQPVFPRPTSGTNDVPVAQLPAPVEEAPLSSSVPEPEFEFESITERVYRIQIMAISNETLARGRGDELGEILGVPVFVEPQRHLFVVRVGNFRDRKEAVAMKEKLTRLHADYKDAYVIALEETRDIPVQVSTNVEPPVEVPPPKIVEAETPPPILVPTFGWRVLLDQFLTHSDAEKMKHKAMRQLKRKDIDVIFKAPWYKVELGNFRTEAQAQEWVEIIKTKRYDNALKIRGQIFVPQEEQ